MMNSHMPYYAPLTQGNDGLMLWLNLDPDYRTTSTTVNDWLNFMKPSEIFSNANTARQPTDNGTHLTFDGGDNLQCNVDRVLTPAGGGWTVCSRYTETDWTSNSTLVADNDSNDSFIKNTGSGLSIKATGTSGTQTKGLNFDTPSDLVDGQYYNIMVTCSTSGLLTCYIDGVAQSATPQFADDTYNLTMSEVGGKNGNAWMMVGNIQEVIVWPAGAVLTALQAADVNTYLNNKF